MPADLGGATGATTVGEIPSPARAPETAADPVGSAEEATDVALRPAYRMRVVFERTVMAPYRDTYRGELGQAQVELLELLYMRGPLRQQDLARELRTSKQHVSKMLARLAEVGHVTLAADAASARGHVAALSDEGRAYVDDHIMQGSRQVQAIFSHLSASEREELAQAMDTVARLLEKV
ncbi:MarR family winged helix-turn-helix transcriptional regulator [Atopobiaceae bacterium HCP3S3_D6]